MRIISGKYKSRRIDTSVSEKDNIKGNISGFRPTTDRAKETLFNVLNNILDFEDVTCLDLFAGSGSLGFEALSRGAGMCDFVESSSIQTAMIKKNAEGLGCKPQINVHDDEVLRFLKLKAGSGYDLIFADPPYAYEYYNELIAEIMQLKFGIFVLEHEPGANLIYNAADYDITEKTIGAVGFTIFISK